MMNTHEINNREALADLHCHWDELFAQTPQGSFFHTLPWLDAYLRFFGRSQRLRLIVVSENGLPFSIVPLVVRNERYRMGTLRVLTYPLDDWGSFYGPIGGRTQEALAAAIEHIQNTERDWDMIDLRWAAPFGSESTSSSVATATQKSFQAAHIQPRRHTWKQTAAIRLDGNWSDYRDSREKKFRAELRRSFRQVEKLGRVEYTRYRPASEAEGGGDPRWSIYDECVHLAIASWQGRSRDGTTLSHSHVREFLRDCHGIAARLGMLDVNLLRIDGELAAFAYNYVHNGYVYGLRVGFDPRFAKAGVGKVLWARSIEDSFDRRDVLYDIGPDSLSVKKHWWTEVIPVQAFAHYAKTPPAQIVRLSHWWKDRNISHCLVPVVTREP